MPPLNPPQTLADLRASYVPQAALSDPLESVLEILRTSEARAVLIQDSGKPAGLFTEHDALVPLLNPAVDRHQPISAFMTPNPLVCHPELPIPTARALMNAHAVPYLVRIDDDGTLDGIVSESDLLAALLAPYNHEAADPRPELHPQQGTRDSLDPQQNRLSDLINNMADWVWEVDNDGRFSFVSDRIQGVLGYDPAWVLGKTPLDLMTREDGERWVRDFHENSRLLQHVANLKYAHRHQDGHTVMLSISGSPIIGDHGALRGYRGVSRDVTEIEQAAQALRNSERQLQAIFDNASVGIMLLTGYRVLSRGNQRLADILGYDSPEAMHGLSMQSLHLAHDRFVEFGQAHYETLRQREQLHVEYELRRKDGSPVWCMLSGKALDSGQPADLSQGVIWIVDDISKRKADALKLADANARLAEERDLFTTGPVMVFRWLPEAGWPVAYCSPNVERILGASPTALINGERAFAEYVHPDDLSRVAGEVQRYSGTGDAGFEQEYRLRAADGEWRNFYDYTRVLRDAQGRIIAFLGYLVDITERHLRQAELRTLLDAIPDLIFFKDEQGCYVECNEAFTRFIGHPREQIIGHSDVELFPADLAAFFQDKDREMLASGTARRNEEWVRYPDGSRYLLDTLKMPFARSGKDRPGVLAISRDITVQHRLRQELEQAQELADIGSGFEDVRTGEVHWSPMLYRILDLDPDTVTPGLSALLSRVVDTDRERVQAKLESVHDAQYPIIEVEYRIRHRSGRIRHIFSRRERIVDELGNTVRIDGVVQDITERTQALRRLTRSEERLREAQQLAHMGSWTLNLTTQALEWSDEVHNIFGTDPTRFQPTREGFFEAVHPDDRDAIAQAFNTALVEHTPYHVVHRLILPDQSIRYVEERARILYDEHQQATRCIGTVLDITDQQLAETALRESEARYRSMFESAGQGLLILGEGGTITSANQAACEMLGYPGPESILSAHPQNLSPPTQPDGQGSFDKGAKMIAKAFMEGHVRFEWDHRHLDGHIVPIEVTLSRITQDGHQALLTSWFNLTDKRRAAELESRASVVFENTSEGIMITDASTRILSVNPAFTKITGYSEDEVRWRRPSFLQSSHKQPGFYELMWRQLQDTGRWQGEIWNRRKNGETYPEWLSISTLRDDTGAVRNYIGVFSDISESHRFEERIEQLINFDPLTQLPNPMLLRARLAQTIDSAKVAGNTVAAILLRIDGFDRMITSLGHESADQVLVHVAERLREVTPKDATLSRFGGDIFALTVELEAKADLAARLAQDMQEQLREGIETREIGRLSITSNVGIAMTPSDTEEGDALLRFAESALHTARDAGPGSLAFYHPAMTEAATRRIQLEQALREALIKDQFELFFQPKISLNVGKMVGVEALIRWRRDDGTLIPPSEFMPIIESSDLVHPVGRWVLRTAAHSVQSWQQSGLGDLRVSVNISGAMISSGILAAEIGAMLSETGLDPALLEIEVLENVLLDDPDLATTQMNEVHGLGVSIALDDFGTGYSSLAYLQRLPFDTIKIDRAFIKDLEHSAASQSVVRATLSMARNMHREVVAEGVETDLQAQQLMRLGCNAVQGYLTGRPMPADDIASMLSQPHETQLSALIGSLTKPKALIVEDDPDQRVLLSNQLEAAHWKVIAVATAEDARVLMSAEPIDLLLVDYGLPGMDGIALLDICRIRHPETVRIMISIANEPSIIQQAINRGGVFRYLVKPVSDELLHETLTDVRSLTQRLWQGGMEQSPP
ncbi:MAG: PAS domain S-box protein [Gammaproteobacteria bacterium]|nr:PAS domain S-box protein [Gammaproteobacteria bacterium]